MPMASRFTPLIRRLLCRLLCMTHIYASINVCRFDAARIHSLILDRTTNLLGALALAVTDRMQYRLRGMLDRSGETAAAIIVLGYAPGLSVEVLRQVLGLSHPGTVRLIDRLEDDGLVGRRRAEDGRAVALHLSRKGQQLRTRLMDDRLNALEASLAGLSPGERLIFGQLIAKVLKNLPETEMDKHRICRLCAVRLCSDCPIPGHAI